MRKILSVILSVALILAVASGCGIARRGDPIPGQNENPGNNNTELSIPKNPGEEQIEETVLFDNGDFKITANRLDVSSYGLEYPDVYLTIENNSNKDAEIYPYLCSINDYMVGAYISDSYLKAHSSLDTTLELYFYDAVEECGTDYLLWMDLNFEFYEPDSYNTILTATDIHLPTTASWGDESCSYDDSGSAVVDNNDFKITLRKLKDDEDGGQYQEIFIRNKSSKAITVELENVAINGKTLDPYFITDCSSNKNVFDHIEFYADDMKNIGVDDITELVLTVIVRDYDTFEEIYNSGPLTITYDE